MMRPLHPSTAMSLRRSTLPGCLAFLMAATASAQFTTQHRTSNAPFLTPSQAVAKMSIPEGFEVSVFASEPDIGEPIAFTFDRRGRVWVVENYNYVNRGAHKENEILSRIQIFEDTDSDGVFDAKKLFSDKIGFASGIACGFGGIYLGAPPHLLFIPDANGDDVPDGEPEVLLDGWGFHDRHETLNSFIWGPDGWLYGCHGVFTRSLVGKPGAPADQRQFIDAGIWRFHPVKKEFEIFAQGLSNPWGFDFNDTGQAFATCCVIPHLFHVVQGGVYHKQSKPHVNPYVFDDIKTIRDHTHLSAHGGARFYLADVFPAKYREQLFMCNIHQHEVLTDYMVRKGSSFIGKHGENFLPTHDPAWVGFSVEIGPDGGVYLLDWHDTDVCGNAINFPKSGRIYRIMPNGAPKIQRPDIGKLSDLELVNLQGHPNDWFVRQARTELQYRASSGKLDHHAAAAALENLFKAAPTEGKKLRALWANHVIGEDQRLAERLDHENEYVRAWSIQLLAENRPLPVSILEKFASLAKNDPSPVVRLYLASACQRLPFENRWEILGALAARAEDVNDPNLPRMLWYALEPAVPRHPEKALAVAIQGKMPFLRESVARRMVSGTLQDKAPSSAEQRARWSKTLQEIAPGFTPQNVGEGGVVRLDSFRNQLAVQTHPLDRNTPCSLIRHLDLPAGKKSLLKVKVSYHPHGDWQLRVLANQDVLHDQIISYKTVGQEWLELSLDLSRYAGRHLDLKLENRANNWSNEFGYWGKVVVETN